MDIRNDGHAASSSFDVFARIEMHSSGFPECVRRELLQEEEIT